MFGGAFDPFHLGHMDIVNGMIQQFPKDRFVVVPSSWSIGKSPPLFSDAQRLAMLTTLFDGHAQVEVSDIEIRTTDPSITLHTVQQLKTLYGVDDMRVVIGADQLINFHNWVQFDQVFDLATVVVFPRHHITSESIEHALGQQLKPFNHRILWLDCQPTAVSSTDIRERLMANQSIDAYVPKPIVDLVQIK